MAISKLLNFFMISLTQDQHLALKRSDSITGTHPDKHESILNSQHEPAGKRKEKCQLFNFFENLSRP